MSWTVPPELLYRSTLPSAPTGATTRFGTVWPATKFRLEVAGRAVPSAYTVTYPGLAGPVTVTFTTTADTPAAGTPPRPVTCRCSVPCAATAAFGAPTPVRVSNNRAGVSDVTPPGMVTAPAGTPGLLPRIVFLLPLFTTAGPVFRKYCPIRSRPI